jgi:energy-coupling factor transporter transmembrane protein EcfT
VSVQVITTLRPMVGLLALFFFVIVSVLVIDWLMMMMMMLVDALQFTHMV